MPPYVPNAGDIVWLEFDPQSGNEQKGRRPALVLSPASYNGKVGLLLCCPITTTAKGYPFEVEVQTAEVSGVVLSDQVKSLNWVARKATKVCAVTPDVLVLISRSMEALLAPVRQPNARVSGQRAG